MMDSKDTSPSRFPRRLLPVILLQCMVVTGVLAWPWFSLHRVWILQTPVEKVNLTELCSGEKTEIRVPLHFIKPESKQTEPPFQIHDRVFVMVTPSDEGYWYPTGVYLQCPDPPPSHFLRGQITHITDMCWNPDQGRYVNQTVLVINYGAEFLRLPDARPHPDQGNDSLRAIWVVNHAGKVFLSQLFLESHEIYRNPLIASFRRDLIQNHPAKLP